MYNIKACNHSLRCAFKSVNMLHEFIQIPTTLAWNIGCEAGVHVQCTLSMTIHAAMRRRVMGLVRRWRLASEKESWCGFRFSVSSTGWSWPAAAAESAKGGPDDGRRSTKNVLYFYFSLLDSLRERKLCYWVCWSRLYLVSAAPCRCHPRRRCPQRWSVAGWGTAALPCCTGSPPAHTEICWT